MDRYYFDSHAVEEHCEWDSQGDWIRYSDVAALESQLQQAQAEAKEWKKAATTEQANWGEACTEIIDLQNELAMAKSNASDNADAMYREIAKNERLEAKLQQAQAEANETYIDENGETWFRPTAEAYYAVCKARNKWQEQSEEWRLDRDFFLARLEAEKEKVEKLQTENAALRADNAELMDDIKAIKINCDQWEAGLFPADEMLIDTQRLANYELDRHHPGDSLLQELEALRAVRDAADALVFTIGSVGETGILVNKLRYALAAAKGVD